MLEQSGNAQICRLVKALEAKRLGAAKSEMEGDDAKYQLTHILTFRQPAIEAEFLTQRRPLQLSSYLMLFLAATSSATLSLIAGASPLSALPSLALFAILTAGILLVDAENVKDFVHHALSGSKRSWFSKLRAEGNLQPCSVAPEIDPSMAKAKMGWEEPREQKGGDNTISKDGCTELGPGGPGSQPDAVPGKEIEAFGGPLVGGSTMAIPAMGEGGWIGMYEACVESLWPKPTPHWAVEYGAVLLLTAMCVAASALTSTDQNPMFWGNMLVFISLPMVAALPLPVTGLVVLGVGATVGFGWQTHSEVGNATNVCVVLWWAVVGYSMVKETRHRWSSLRGSLNTLESLEHRQSTLFAEMRSHFPLNPLGCAVKQPGQLVTGAATEHKSMAVLVLEAAVDLNQSKVEETACVVQRTFVELDHVLRSASHIEPSLTKVGTFGHRYVVAVGLEGGHTPDQLAQSMVGLCKDLVRCGGSRTRMGAHFGPAVLAVGEKYLPMLNIWGEAMDVATQLCQDACVGCVHLTSQMAQMLRVSTAGLQAGGTMVTEGVSYNTFHLASQGPAPWQHVHDVVQDMRVATTAVKERGLPSRTQQKAMRHEAQVQWERQAGTRPECEQGLGPLQFGVGASLCNQDRFGFWTYTQWRSRSTLAMVAVGGLNLTLTGVSLGYLFHQRPEERSLLLMSSHLVAAVLLLCAAVTAQTLLFFRKSSAVPAFWGTTFTGVSSCAALIALVACTPGVNAADIEAAFLAGALVHLHGIAITSLDRFMALSFMFVMAVVAVGVLDGAHCWESAVRIFGSFVCAIGSCAAQHSSLCTSYLMECGMPRNLRDLEEPSPNPNCHRV